MFRPKSHPSRASLALPSRSRLTFSVRRRRSLALRRAAAVVVVGARRVGAVVRRGYGRPPLAEKNPGRHGPRPARRLGRSSVELVVRQAAVSGVGVVLRRAAVLRGLLNHHWLLFGAFLLLLGFLLLLLKDTDFIGWPALTGVPTGTESVTTYLVGELCCCCGQTRFYGGHSRAVSRRPLLSGNRGSNARCGDIHVKLENTLTPECQT